MDNNSVKILIGADIVPTAASQEYFERADLDTLLGGELRSLLESADLRLFNLETPLFDGNAPIAKCGPALRASEKSINGLRAIGPSCLTTANNHIMDHGEAGLSSTLRLLDSAGIGHVGTGNNLREAAQPWIKSVNGRTIGVYACAEHEFSIAGEDHCGANPFDPLESYDHVAALKQACDFVIVLYHGGKELYRYPSPNLLRYCRKFIDKGADLVVCQHSHCIGCAEDYKSGAIVYGQGNFLFSKYDNEFWNSSLLVEAVLDDSGCRLRYIPLKRQNAGIRMDADGENGAIYADFRKRCEEIQQDGFVEKTYRAFALNPDRAILGRMDFLAGSFPFKALNRLSGKRLEKWYWSTMLRKKRMSMRNTIECEAWRELMLEYLKNSK